MIRLVVRTAIVLAGNAVGLIVASLVLDGFAIDVTGFVVSLVIFTIAVALMTPFLASTMRRNQSDVGSAGGRGADLDVRGVAASRTLLSDGVSISGIGDVDRGDRSIVWLGSLLAVFILPFLGLKKYLENRPG